MLAILDSTVLITALDADRPSHTAARSFLDSGTSMALTTQTIRETLAVSTRPVNANGLGISVSQTWAALEHMRHLCGQILFENDGWLNAFGTLLKEYQPSGRSLYDLGQVAHVIALRRQQAYLLTDDAGLQGRYSRVCSIKTVLST